MSASFRQGIVENATASERIARAQTIWPEDDDGHLVLTAFECDDGVLCLHFPGSSRLVSPMLDRLCHDVSRSIVCSKYKTSIATTTQLLSTTQCILVPIHYVQVILILRLQLPLSINSAMPNTAHKLLSCTLGNFVSCQSLTVLFDN